MADPLTLQSFRVEASEMQGESISERIESTSQLLWDILQRLPGCIAETLAGM